MPILIDNQQQDVVLDTASIEAKIRHFLETLELTDWSAAVVFVDTQTSQDYNQKYRQKNYPANVLSFPFASQIPGQSPQPDENGIKDLGDLILCPSVIVKDAQEWQVSFEERLHRLLAHGLLHLLGYDHHTDDEYAIMKAMEEKLLGHTLAE